MRYLLGITTLLIGLAGCTAAEEKAFESSMSTSDAMEAKARAYCNVSQGYEIGGKSYMQCTEHYMQGLMDASKKTQ